MLYQLVKDIKEFALPILPAKGLLLDYNFYHNFIIRYYICSPSFQTQDFQFG